MILILFCVLFVYVVLISLFIFGFAKIKSKPIDLLVPKTRFTIVVPFRNEATNLPHLLHSFSLLNYPKELFEVILVDDDSEDLFEISKTSFQIQVISNCRKSNSPKKDAIETAISLANNEWIITTDADCLVQENWLNAFDSYIQKTKMKMVVAGVCYKPENGFLHAFQNLDFLSLQGATIGSFGINQPFMCNGANFAYEKAFFTALKGFEGNSSIASGDDVFLLQKAIKNEPINVGFLFDFRSIVATKSSTRWTELFHQRVRWASKSTSYSSFFGKLTALVVFVANFSFILCFALWICNVLTPYHLVLFIGFKFLLDLLLLTKTANYFKTRIKWVFLSSLIYPLFSCNVAMYSLFGQYHWKGRRFKK